MNRCPMRSGPVACVLALGLLHPPTAVAAQSTRAAIIARIDSIAQAPVKSGAVAGLAVAVVKGRDTLLMKGYGMADLEQQVPVTPATVFRIGSLTKQFTSSAIMRLVEQHTISLDDDLTKYVSSYPTRGRAMPLRYLLNHTSGIPSYTDIGAPFGKVMRLDLAPDSLIALVANDSLQFEPGTHMYYNNTGYFLLGMVLEKATGAKYGEYLERTMFAPAGLSHTIYCDTRRIIPQRANGYDRAPTGLLNADYIGMQLPFAAGSLCSTVGDLVSWTQQLNSGRIVSAASYREMTTPVKLPSGRPMTYAYGLSSDTVAGHRVISHGGGINGFISFLLNAPQDSLIVAVLANTTPAPSDAVANAIMRVVLGLPPAPAPTAIKDLALSATERARYAGEYALAMPDGVRQALRVIEQGDQLMLQAATGVPMRLRSQGAQAFVGMDGSRLTFDVKADHATGFVFGTGSRRLEAVRTK
jgi:D-alanyl-D-alanine carboxypeptidase